MSQREWAAHVVYSSVTTIGGNQTPAGTQLVMRRKAPDGQWQYREATQGEYDEWAELMER